MAKATHQQIADLCNRMHRTCNDKARDGASPFDEGAAWACRHILGRLTSQKLDMRSIEKSGD
jgi:hypothetical protein